MSEIIKIITQEITNITPAIAINAFIIIGFWWFLSKFAKSTIPRLLWLGLGAYLLLSPKPDDVVFYDIDTMVGIGMVLPHIKFFFEWIYELYEELKRATIDTYIFTLTIYYKIRRFFLWFYSVYKKIHNFFTKKQDSKQEKTDYYQEQQQQEYKHYKENSKFYDETKRRKEQREQKESSSSKYEEKSDEQSSDYSQEETYQEKSYQENSSHTEEQVYEEPEVRQGLSLEEQLMQDERYKHFFSDSIYTIIGVSINDDFKTMKKRFHKLSKEFHPDKNFEEYEKYNILYSRISSAYQDLEKFHKK